jgi:hypothetical protein
MITIKTPLGLENINGIDNKPILKKRCGDVGAKKMDK